MLLTPRPEPVRKAQKVLFPDRVENLRHRTLDDFVFQCRDPQWPFPPIVFVDPDSPRRLRAIGPTMDTPVEVGHPVHTRRARLFRS
jgi:hypothetical protein